MTVVIKKGTTKSEVKKLLMKLNKPNENKGLRQFLGKPIMNEKVDAVEYQRKLRDEWN
jgi:hypothetical protein